MPSVCRARLGHGVFRVRQQSDVGVVATLQTADGVRVESVSHISLGEGQVDQARGETPTPGSGDPVLGSYGHGLEFTVLLYIPGTGDLTADHYLRRLLRACGFAVTIATGTATVTPLAGGCAGDEATEVLPLTAEFAEGGGVTYGIYDAVGQVTSVQADAGGFVRFSIQLMGRLRETPAATGALPTVSYPAQDTPLVARNATAVAGDLESEAAAIPGLYSWSLSPGVTAESVPDQLSPTGLAIPFVASMETPVLEFSSPVQGTFSAGMWADFIGQQESWMEIEITGNAGSEIFTLTAPRAFPSVPGRSDTAGHRVDDITALLKPGPSTAEFTMQIHEETSP